jgi:predicted Zn-dependent protease
MRSITFISLLIAALLASDVASAVSLADEKKLGRQFALEAAAQMPTVNDPAVVDLVRDMGKRLVAGLDAQPFEYRFQIVAHPAINAFAVPGGYIYVFSGLIGRSSSVDELASVLGHEVAHVHAHHVSRQQDKTQLWNYAGLLGLLLTAVHPVLGAGAMAASQSASLKYSRQFEEEADLLGLRFMHTAGYDPAAMSGFFKKIQAEQRINPAGVPPYLLTHPLTEDRIARVESVLATYPRAPKKGLPGAARELEEARAAVWAATSPSEVVLEDYQQRADEAPADGFAQYLLGIVSAAKGRLDAAREAFEKARKLKGAGHRLPMRLAKVYLRLGRPEDAKGELDVYLREHGDDAFARSVSGQTLLELGKEAEAIAQLEGSLHLDPTLIESHRLLGQAYGRNGREGEAFYHLAKASELRGQLQQALSRYTRAREALDESEPRHEEVVASIAELGEMVRPERRGGQRY